ncbi:ankyrin repeat-containing domain protein [Xylariaceae sp. FL0594]|nr:ankyrin repeat-containing domain protein [Xylariaceae sp. FL0594]
MDINSQWSETDLVDDPERRRAEGWRLIGENYTWADCSTPLHMAMAARSMKTVELLILRGADMDICNARGHTVLYEAVCQRHIFHIDLYLSYGVDPNIPTLPSQVSCGLAPQPFVKHSEHGGDLPLFRAISEEERDFDTINKLLEHGARVNQPVFGWQCLDLATLARDHEIMAILLSNGAQFSTLESSVVDGDSSPETHNVVDIADLPSETKEIAKRLIGMSECSSIRNTSGRCRNHPGGGSNRPYRSAGSSGQATWPA